MDTRDQSGAPHVEQPGSQWTVDGIADALRQGRVRGVRMWPSAPSDDVFREGAQRAGWRCLTLDTENIVSKAGYIAACGEQLPLPDYLGHNWDALEEALGDEGVAAENAGAEGLMVCWRNWSAFAIAEPAAFQVALAIWRSVAADWRERLDGAGVVLAVDDPHVTADLPESVAEEITGISRVRGN